MLPPGRCRTGPPVRSDCERVWDHGALCHRKVRRARKYLFSGRKACGPRPCRQGYQEDADVIAGTGREARDEGRRHVRRGDDPLDGFGAWRRLAMTWVRARRAPGGSGALRGPGTPRDNLGAGPGGPLVSPVSPRGPASVGLLAAGAMVACADRCLFPGKRQALGALSQPRAGSTGEGVGLSLSTAWAKDGPVWRDDGARLRRTAPVPPFGTGVAAGASQRARLRVQSAVATDPRN